MEEEVNDLKQAGTQDRCIRSMCSNSPGEMCHKTNWRAANNEN